MMLPNDLDKMIGDSEALLEKKEAAYLQTVINTAKRFGIKVERIAMPVNICGDEAHATVVVNPDNLDEWMSDKASPLKLYKVHLGKEGPRIRVCECTHTASPLELLARQANH